MKPDPDDAMANALADVAELYGIGLPLLPAGVSLTRNLSLPTTDPDLERDIPDLQKVMRTYAPDTSFALTADGQMVGYAALMPGEPGYCHAVLYISPVARNLGEGLRSVALALGRGLIALASRLGYRALAAHPKSPGQLRYACSLGGAESGLEFVLPHRLVLSPVLIWRFHDDGLDGAEIARRCLPQHYVEKGDAINAMIERTRDLVGVAYRPPERLSASMDDDPPPRMERRAQKENAQTFLVRPSAVVGR
jgi:hypothetical protein